MPNIDDRLFTSLCGAFAKKYLTGETLGNDEAENIEYDLDDKYFVNPLKHSAVYETVINGARYEMTPEEWLIVRNDVLYELTQWVESQRYVVSESEFASLLESFANWKMNKGY